MKENNFYTFTKNFVLPSGDVVSDSESLRHNTNSLLSPVEAYAMAYDLINDREIKDKIINRIIFYINLSPHSLPYVVDLRTFSLYEPNHVNMQHSFWVSKVLHDHFILTQDKKFYDFSLKVFNAACDFFQKTNFSNWSESTRFFPSIKALTCMEVFHHFDKVEILNQALDFYEKELFNHKIGLYNSKIEIPEFDHLYHENLELAEGFYCMYRYTLDSKYLNKAQDILKSLKNHIANTKNNMSRLQFYFLSQLLDFDNQFIESKVKEYLDIFNSGNNLRPYDRYQLSYSRNGQQAIRCSPNDIFMNIYLLRIFTDYKLFCDGKLK